MVPLLLREFGPRAEVVTGIGAGAIPPLLGPGAAFLLASVHPAIVQPDDVPPRKGGHLVLVTRACATGGIVFHNPSGYEDASRENVRLPLATFDRFFAGRGIVVKG